jgi:hypothetical protein
MCSAAFNQRRATANQAQALRIACATERDIEHPRRFEEPVADVDLDGIERESL